MEFEEIVKRLEWLDNQQRQNKEAITKLDERFESLDASVNAISKQIKALSKQMSEVSPAAKRVEQFETIISKQRADLVKMIDDREKLLIKSEKDSAKRTQTEIENLNKTLTRIESEYDAASLKKQMKERGDEIQRILNNINDLKSRIDAAGRSNEDAIHSLKAMDETRKNDLKRIADLQGELASLRKRVDENREKAIIAADAMRNLESRITELLASEMERKQSQSAFIEEQRLAQLDRDKSFKDWRENFEKFQKDAQSVETQVQALDEALRGAKKAQDTYLELNTKLERRINEVTEMQRLAEERLRQEWISFKADDQKRWTGYNLSSEEALRDVRKDLQKFSEQLTALGDTAHMLQDQMHQTTDTTEKQLQEIMNAAHEWMSSYQRIMGHGKKSKK